MSKAHFPTRTRRSRAEWISLGISAFIVLSLIALVIFNRLNRGNKPPALQAIAVMSELRVHEGLYYLPIQIENKGSIAAKAVKVGAEVSGEFRDFEIDFLDGQEKARGTLVFTNDPRAQLKVAVISYKEP
jgi:uncharacterized protein (TIGR02588 family)